MTAMGHLRPSCTIAADGSLSPDSFRARRKLVTEEMGPGCVKTRTLFFKVEFWPRLGGNSSQEIFRHHREGTTKEKDSQQVSRRSVFTQPGPIRDILASWYGIGSQGATHYGPGSQPDARQRATG